MVLKREMSVRPQAELERGRYENRAGVSTVYYNHVRIAHSREKVGFNALMIRRRRAKVSEGGVHIAQRDHSQICHSPPDYSTYVCIMFM